MPDLPLTDGELHSMRHTIDAYLPGTAVILTAARSRDRAGGQDWVYAAAGTVDARLSPEMLRASEGPLAGRVAEVGRWILTVPASTTIDEDDRVTYASVTYDVSEVLTRAPWELSRRVRLVEVD